MKITRPQLYALSKAIIDYKFAGYEDIEVPWLISKEANDITMPSSRRAFETQFGILPGSAEQSFLHMMLEGKLAPGKYQTITPCFRDEPKIDELHLQYFLKLELIDTTPEKDYRKMIRHAQEFFASIGIPTEIKETSDVSADLKYKQYQLGSYGLREYKHLSWAYGTGLAEPRASYVWDVVQKDKWGEKK